MTRALRPVLAAVLVATVGATIAGGAGAQPPVPASPAGGGDALGLLMARFAAMPGMSARFREEKRIGLLAAPLVSEGTLHFARPGHLARIVVRPEASAMRVVGDRLTVERGGRVEAIDLARHGAVRSLVDGLRRMLAGDRPRLERAFRVRHTAAAGGGWTLRLLPRDAATARLVREMRVAGEGTRLRTLQVDETSGDVAVTTFTEVNAARRYGREELRRLFGSR